ncbi:MAG TPA: PilC/PilY family type IV pilus protein [Noviherbaspirillum sp.]|jgi:type IV pilus assembly protein PilY1|uniref:pilus assembly protein n=1 Tax=Noviherbaspirillum sp. TaxID=1926288 RepID=UPI002DDD3A7D|nr:PilC/PilY family type IV pilus protein [Noviherbaspirillum sp.]HEV2609430.1 PilC/PilY family type IV pilus protein [Noviherbaspirillum sp.]
MKNNNVVAALAFLALQTTHVVQAATNPDVKIATEPMFGGRGNVHPNLVLNLSVEFPTAGIAYRGDGGTYNRTTEYVGYFNPAKCYLYNGGNRNLSDTGYFVIAKDADPITRECGGDTFSGNFMNWATSSAIDMLRYALTGGDRIIDTPDITILQRAVLKDTFYAHSTYFPRRTVVPGGNVSAPDRVTPFRTGTLHIVSCGNRVLFSDVSSGLANASGTDANRYCTSAYSGAGMPPREALDKKLGEFLVRVKVCDGKEGASRTDLCQRFGSQYKPVGEIQRKADRLRLAAMGYVLDDAETRYGGVLRAPMKYVGAKKLEAPDFIELPNDKAEWDSVTGVLYTNPEDPVNRNSGVENSGVINYLNKFGRSGKYKTFDPVGELFYEGLHYLQGKEPTAESAVGITSTMKDGFPVIQNSPDPVIASCQQNYMLTVADVNTHWDRFIPGNQRTTYGSGQDAFDSARPAEREVAGKTPALDVRTWTRRVGDLENHASNPAPNPLLTNLDNRDTGASGHGTYYMAGLAYWANTNDIRLDKPVRVKTFAIDVDEGGNGQIDGNTRSLKPRDSQLYLAAKYGGFDDRNGDGNPFVTFAPNGKSVISGSNAEWDNDGNGVPDTYFLAGQPKEMIAAVKRVFNKIGQASGNISGVAATGGRMSTDGIFVYQPGFESSTWAGSLKKLALKPGAGGNIDIASTPDWDAGELLSGFDLPANDVRKIFTAQINSGALRTIEFKWDQLSGRQKELLSIDPVSGKPDALGESRLAYLRGQRSLESGKPGGVFRTRTRVLGDIVNSNAVYAGPPSPYGQGTGYAQFQDALKGRTKAVYIGANDGMLHAFNAQDGRELFAYVPNAVIRHLAQLTSPDYLHRPYVDGMLTVGEARIGARWKTILAAGMGGGGQGLFALDVTEPGNFGAGTGALWEFTDADDPDMGNLAGAPVIVKFASGTPAGPSEYRYFVAAPSGLNNYTDDGSFNKDAAGALFLLALDKAPSVKWELGVNYYKFRMPASDPTLQNGLSAPAVVADQGGGALYAYAGDLQGNLWRFDFSAAPPFSGGGTLLFVAQDAAGNRQPISTQPKVVYAPGGGYLVLFGTGKFFENRDAAAGEFKTQSFYAIHDAVPSRPATVMRHQLVRRVLTKTGDAIAVNGKDFSYGGSKAETKGWFFDFVQSDKTGERSVTPSLISNGKLFFNSLIPGGDPCDLGGGRSYAFDVLTGFPQGGATTGNLSTVGMMSSPMVVETASAVSQRNAIGRRTARKTQLVINFGTGGVKGATVSSEKESIESIVPAGRFSWRELVNWQELRNAIAK